MALLTLGLNHKSAPVEIRERLSFGPDIITGALRELLKQPGVEEALILSTCNRTEIYCGLAETESAEVAHWLAQFHGLEVETISPYLYQRHGEDAVRHLLRVACGLDSLILGEPQILGQVKSAYQTAVDASSPGKVLCRLFQSTFAVAKQVRTDTAIGRSPVSVAFAAVSLARQIFADLSQQTALLIGAGETIELAARHLSQHGIGRIIVANRTVERAHGLATQFGGFAIGLTEIAAHLPEADIVISSTASPLPVLGKGTVESALKKRRHRPIFMVDIAVPRDIESEVDQLDDVYLYTVDDLDEVIQENMRSRQEAAEQAQEIIDFHVDDFMGWVRSLDAIKVVQDFRRQAEDMRDDVLERALRQVRAGKPAEEALHYLARTLTNKFLHAPSTAMRQAGHDGEQTVLEAANNLFRIQAAKNNR